MRIPCCLFPGSRLFPPAERPLALYTGVVIARFMSAIETDVDKKKKSEQGSTDLITKYDLADRLELTDTEDEAKLHAMAAQAFSNLDQIAFMADLEAYMKKHKPSSVEDKKAKPVSLKGLKTEGNEAKATMVSSDGGEEPLLFIKSGGRWFLSWEQTFNNPKASNYVTTELSLIITFDSERSLKAATAKGLLQSVAYDRSSPTMLERTKSPLQAKLTFMKPTSSESRTAPDIRSIMDTIKQSRGVSKVEHSFAIELKESLESDEFKHSVNVAFKEAIRKSVRTGANGQANTRAKQKSASAPSPLMICQNNLKQIGLSLRILAYDHHDAYPFNISTNKGGSLEYCQRTTDGFDANSLRHFRVISNELNNPNLLVCPADTSKQAADFWSPSWNWGKLAPSNVTYQIRSLSKLSLSHEKVLILCPFHGIELRWDGAVVEGSRTDADAPLPPIPGEKVDREAEQPAGQTATHGGTQGLGYPAVVNGHP